MIFIGKKDIARSLLEDTLSACTAVPEENREDRECLQEDIFSVLQSVTGEPRRISATVPMARQCVASAVRAGWGVVNA